MKRAPRIVALTALAALAGCAGQSAQSGGSASTTESDKSRQKLADETTDMSPEQVRLVQRSLSERGFAVSPTGTVDGRTQAALNDFQQTQGLPVTGRPDAPTLASLGIDPREVEPVRGRDEPGIGFEQEEVGSGGE